jgi:hypothetical protein
MVVASMWTSAQSQLLEVARGSFWHAAMLRLCGAQVERGVFLDSMVLLVRAGAGVLVGPDVWGFSACLVRAVRFEGCAMRS